MLIPPGTASRRSFHAPVFRTSFSSNRTKCLAFSCDFAILFCWCAAGQAIFLAAANDRITGCITAKEAADIHFFARKQFTGQENADGKARKVLTKLLSLFEVLDTLSEDRQNALAIDNGDYEGAMMIAAASRSRIDRIVTRNTVHFQMGSVPVYSPGDLLSLIGSAEK